MNKYVKMLIFVVVLGGLTSGLLLGMEYLTAERIEANDAAKLKSRILDGFNLEYTDTTINSVFDDNVVVTEIDDYTFYQDSDGRLTFYFEGGGVWGPITGLLTLNSDLKTIEYITILEQEETPGLGGVVAERPYLEKFVSKEMILNIDKFATDSVNEVDAITGATRTSEAFETILNDTYNTLIPLWTSQ